MAWKIINEARIVKDDVSGAVGILTECGKVKIVGSGSGSAQDATQVEYDSTASGLNAVNVQGAVDQLQLVKANNNDVYSKAETDSAITAKVSEIVAGAPEDFNTLKEMSDWLTEHEDSAASMNTAIQKNATDISNRYTKEETDSRYLGKTEPAGAAVHDAAGGNIAEQFEDIAVKNSSGWVYAGSNQLGWHKAAECAFSEVNSGRRIASFYISGTTSSISGILNVNVLGASSSTLAVNSIAARWGYRSNSINPENFVLVAKVEDGKIRAELWIKLTSTWQAYNFIRLRSVRLTTEIYDDTAWKAYNSTTASESYPTDYDLTSVSVDNSAATYDADGNNIATTYLPCTGGKLIPSGSDINTAEFCVPGGYRAGSNAIAATLLNCPTQAGFSMDVKATVGVDRLVRFIYPNVSSGTFYQQNVTADGFGPWYKHAGEVVETTATTAE